MESKLKTIGLLGGTGWSSTIGYYKLLNELVARRLGGYHSAKILLKSIDYHDIHENYGKNHDMVASLLKTELQGLIALKPDCIIICCNSLHKYYDMISQDLSLSIPVMHAVHLVAENLKNKGAKSALLLATKFTMEDGFFAKILEENGIHVTIPNEDERNQMQSIHAELMHNNVRTKSQDYFKNLTQKYQNLDAVVLGCTEYPLLLTPHNSHLPIINPVELQAISAVNYAVQGVNYEK